MEIKRNYKKEWEKEKETKISKLVKIDKKLYEDLSKKLKEENKTFSGLVNEAILEYLHDEKN